MPRNLRAKRSRRNGGLPDVPGDAQEARLLKEDETGRSFSNFARGQLVTARRIS